MSNNRNANLMKEMEQELSHILKCLELYIPIHLKFNVDTRRIEYMKYRSAASLILMALSNLAMVYYTYFDTFLDNETKFAMKFLQYNFASVFLAKIWFLLFVAVHYKTDTIRLWNDLLTLNDRHRSLRLVCRTFKRTVLLILLIPTSWNLLYDLANLHNAIRFEGNPERCYAFVLIVTDFISTVTCLVHITLLTMFASYFKQLCEKLDAIVREDYGEVFELTLKEIMRSFECFYDMVLRTVKLTSPLLLAMLSHSMLIITRSLCEICTKIFIGKGYMHFEIATELYVAFGAFVFSGMLIVPCELCMNYANSIQSNLLLTFSNFSRRKEAFKIINVFSLQLLHNNLRIVAGGVVPLDFSTIFGILGVTTTLLVFLIQYKNDDFSRYESTFNQN